jgi:hypothetical protein
MSKALGGGGERRVKVEIETFFRFAFKTAQRNKQLSELAAVMAVDDLDEISTHYVSKRFLKGFFLSEFALHLIDPSTDPGRFGETRP